MTKDVTESVTENDSTSYYMLHKAPHLFGAAVGGRRASFDCTSHGTCIAMSSRLEDEIEAIRSIYDDAAVAHVLGSGSNTTGEHKVTITLANGLKLIIFLSDGYPEGSFDADATIISHEGASRKQLESVNLLVKERLAAYLIDAPSSECLLFIIQAAQELLEQLIGNMPQSSLSSNSIEEAERVAQTSTSTKRVWVWFHHIKSPVKKRFMLDLAGELHLQGLCKPGFPGALYLEGSEHNVDEAVSRLKALRWQAMVVRHEEMEPSSSDSVTSLGWEGLRMLEEGEMNTFAANMRQIGKEEQFKQAILKL